MIQKLKNVICSRYIITNIFYVLCISLFICSSISPFLTLYKMNKIRSIFFLVSALLIVAIYIYILKKIKVEKKWIEYILVAVIILIGLFLRVGVNRVLKTYPVSDFNTPHSVYNALNSGEDIFSKKATTEELTFYQRYYAMYPAWYTYMKIISFVYDVFGHKLRYIKIMNWLLYCLSALLVYWIAKKIMNKKIGYLAISLFACFPSLILYTNITTPDHFSLLFFLCFIASWVKMFEYRKTFDKRLYLWGFINIIFIVCINLFKPLSILGLLVFICSELLCFIFPILFNKEKIKYYLKKHFLFSIIFVVICTVSIFGSSKILNYCVEKQINTKVVDSTGLYLLWGYSIDENKNYNSQVATGIFEDLLVKYKYDLKKVMDEISVLAKEQIKNNLKYLPTIFHQKFQIGFSNEDDIFSFSNNSNNIYYQADMLKKYKNIYVYFANIFMSVLWIMSSISLLKEIFDDEKNNMKTVLALTILGYILVLLLGGIQGRYKMLISGVLCILASTCCSKKEEVK